MITKLRKAIGMFLLAGFAGFAGSGVYNSWNKPEITAAANTTGSSQPIRLTGMLPGNGEDAPTQFVAASEASVPAVVHVKTTYSAMTAGNGQYYNPFQDFFWGDRGAKNPAPAMSAGSGVIITDDGYIVTNNHVVANSDKVEVTLNDKRTLLAKVIGTDPSTDLALLKIEDKGLPFIPYGNSDGVRVGEWVLAVGNPFNLTSTVTAGIVSAKARNIHILPDQQFPIESFIQTDAAVNPGNSGGALVNTNGELIGINTAIASSTGSYSGYSFAIPVNMVKKVVDDLLEYGNVQRGFIGVNIKDIDSELASEKGIKSLKGVYVAGITDGGAAASAGIQEGDIITKVHGTEVNSSPELQEQVSRFRPGDKIDVTILRSGSVKSVALTLRNKDGNMKIVTNEIVSLLGAEFETISKEEGARLGVLNDVKISKLNAGKLRSAGIREGFIIESIDNRPVASAEDIVSALKNKKGGVLIEGIYPNGVRAYHSFGL
ncbi:MAG: Do family serine endopeptidase [Bacteroidetes bacterium]|nr:Do family serine endopeptidase [Bacteroidota bacterium]